MKVKLTCHANKRFRETVYASVHCADDLLINATLDYCLSACAERGYTIENAQDVLMWLHKNADFVAY